jgi:hypothetical protein
MPDKLIDIKEGRKLTGYSEAYLRILAARGTIKAQKMGNAWALSKVSLLRFVEKQQQGDGRFGPRSGVTE